MEINILGKTKDLRTDTHVIYAQISVKDYLYLIGDDFDKFAIQRRRVASNKAYDRMRADIQKGALLPCITLAVKPELVSTLRPLVEANNFPDLAEKLSSKPGNVNILDGLQRTFILKDLQKDLQKNKLEFPPEQSLLVEFWFEEDIRKLIYRIIVLNAGQKRMSMRHQVEILFSTFKDVLEKQIKGIEIYQEKEGSSRKKPGRYALDRIVTSYQCFLFKSPETQKENIVAQELMEEDALNASEQELSNEFENFIQYLKIYYGLDREICRVYVGDKERGIPKGVEWFGSEPVMNSFFAAIAMYGLTEQRRQSINNALDRLKSELIVAVEDDDPINLEDLQRIINGFNPRKVNVGYVTRKLMTNALREFFSDDGVALSECWKRAAE